MRLALELYTVERLATKGRRRSLLPSSEISNTPDRPLERIVQKA